MGAKEVASIGVRLRAYLDGDWKYNDQTGDYIQPQPQILHGQKASLCDYNLVSNVLPHPTHPLHQVVVTEADFLSISPKTRWGTFAVRLRSECW